MKALSPKPRGYTLVELVAVLVLLGILSAAVFSRFTSPSVFELQAGRDQVVAAIHSAQQLAMAQRSRVRFLAQGNQISILLDTNGDGAFLSSEAITVDGVAYPYTLPSGQSITAASFDFDRLGRTSAGAAVLSHQDASVTVNVTAVGFVN